MVGTLPPPASTPCLNCGVDSGALLDQAVDQLARRLLQGLGRALIQMAGPGVQAPTAVALARPHTFGNPRPPAPRRRGHFDPIDPINAILSQFSPAALAPPTTPPVAPAAPTPAAPPSTPRFSGPRPSARRRGPAATGRGPAAEPTPGPTVRVRPNLFSRGFGAVDFAEGPGRPIPLDSDEKPRSASHEPRPPRRQTGQISLELECPACGTQVRAAMGQLGHQFACRECGTRLQLNKTGELEMFETPREPASKAGKKPSESSRPPGSGEQKTLGEQAGDGQSLGGTRAPRPGPARGSAQTPNPSPSPSPSGRRPRTGGGPATRRGDSPGSRSPSPRGSDACSCSSWAGSGPARGSPEALPDRVFYAANAVARNDRGSLKAVMASGSSGEVASWLAKVRPRSWGENTKNIKINTTILYWDSKEGKAAFSVQLTKADPSRPGAQVVTGEEAESFDPAALGNVPGRRLAADPRSRRRAKPERPSSRRTGIR